MAGLGFNIFLWYFITFFARAHRRAPLVRERISASRLARAPPVSV